MIFGVVECRDYDLLEKLVDNIEKLSIIFDDIHLA